MVGKDPPEYMARIVFKVDLLEIYTRRHEGRQGLSESLRRKVGFFCSIYARFLMNSFRLLTLGS